MDKTAAHPRMLRTSEAAERIGVSRETLLAYCKQGKIRSIITPGGQRRIPESEVDRMLEGLSA